MRSMTRYNSSEEENAGATHVEVPFQRQSSAVSPSDRFLQRLQAAESITLVHRCVTLR